VSSYRRSVDSASPVAADAPPGAPAPGVLPVSMVAFRAAELQDRGKSLAGRAGAALVASPGAGMAAGTLVTFCHPVVSVPAVVRRDGTVPGRRVAARFRAAGRAGTPVPCQNWRTGSELVFSAVIKLISGTR
jgi:hypothetical protein